jgi:Transposon-encoded protein TnpV
MEATWARLYRETMKEQRPDLFRRLQESGRLKAHVAAEARRASDQFQNLFAALRKKDPGPVHDTIALSQHLAGLASQAREVVATELLEPLADPSG